MSVYARLMILAFAATPLALSGCGSSKAGLGNSPGQPVIAWSPPPPESDDADKQAAADMLRVFLDPCQGKFPDDAAVAKYAADHDLTAMSANDVSELLGKDPGVGWVQHDSSGTYWLTVEAPPFHTCAVRTNFTRKPTALTSYLALALGVMVSNAGDHLEQRPRVSAEKNGVRSTIDAFLRINASGKLTEQYLVIVSAFPDGSYPTRLVRQIISQ